MLHHSSTIASLAPDMATEPLRKELRSKLRYSGSRQMMLRRPNRSPDFARPYVAGDPVRFLDWKAFARSDQLIIREVRDKADIEIRIFIDGSDSMFWPDRSVFAAIGRKVPTKFELAVRMALTVTAGHVAAGDVVRIYWGDPTNIPSLKVVNFKSVADVSSFFENISKGDFRRIRTASSTDNRLLTGRATDFGMLFSDGFNMDALSRVATGCAEITFFQTLSTLELESDWMNGSGSYFDHVGSSAVEYSGNDLKRMKVFDSAVKSWVDKQLKTCADYGWHYQMFHEQSRIAHFFGFLSMINEGAGHVVRG